MLLHLARTQRLSFIRAPCHHDALSFYPLTCHRYNIHYNRTRTSSPQTLVYMNFQLLMCTAHMLPCAWWALTPPSHPYRSTGASRPWAHHAAAVVFFCSLPLSPAASIFRSRALFAARTFLSPPPLSLHQHLTSRCNRGLAVNCERGRKGPATNQATALPHAKVIKLFHSTSICYAIFFISKRE